MKITEEFFRLRKEETLKRIKANIPVDTGNLRDNTIVDIRMERNEIITEFKTNNVPYAAKVHEDPNFVPKKIVTTMEGIAGNKFMSRAIEYEARNSFKGRYAKIVRERTKIDMKDIE